MAEIKGKILVVDDDKYIARACVTGLSMEGLEVVVVANGRDAMEKIRSEHPDLVLLDLVMVNKTGFDILQEMKAEAGTREIPAIIFSNMSRPEDMEKAKDLGAAGYLVKSEVSMHEIVEKVMQVLKKR